MFSKINTRRFGITPLFSFVLLWAYAIPQGEETIPLPEHPRPDFQRENWINLNGIWEFEFDEDNNGKEEAWFKEASFTKKIQVPFSWGSPLSGLENEAEIGWYKREITVPESWEGNRIYLNIGASDWITDAWIDGEHIGSFQGGYTPFDFELTAHVRFGETQTLTLRVDDSPHDFKLFGKQGYGEAKGIWQTVYLESRGQHFINQIHITPNIENGTAEVNIKLNEVPEKELRLLLNIQNDKDSIIISENKIKRKKDGLIFSISIPEARLWTLDDPFLYHVEAIIANDSSELDRVKTYFGMRSIGVVNLPGTDIPYVSLNNEPIYLQLALDQAYHPGGYYTFPSDDFVRDEIIRTKKLGLNGQRVHVKVTLPRKLYWADKLGVLIMADVPNSWGEPDENMRNETEVALRGMIERDFNHPSIFSWVIFNETWGLKSTNSEGKKVYMDETKIWVEEMYQLAKKLDPTRLVEDNSANQNDHVATDLNTWHAYLPGYQWKSYMRKISEDTYPESEWNFAEGFQQESQPMLNSECGNVWGYTGSTGDVDWSWDYHIMMNEFRRHPKMAGWLYTEHHDVINEWNGYYKYDRSSKETGLDEIMSGMSLKDLHSEVYISPGTDLCQLTKPRAMVAIPLWLSVMTDKYKNQKVLLQSILMGWNTLGEQQVYSEGNRTMLLNGYQSGELSPLVIRMPDEEGLMILKLKLTTTNGEILQQNFTTFYVQDNNDAEFKIAEENERKLAILTFDPASFVDANWSQKQWNILDSLKVNGAGSGFFEYEVKIPEELKRAHIKSALLKMEISSKPMLGKDKAKEELKSDDYMRGKGFHDRGRNPNSYPMTDEDKNPSQVRFMINGLAEGWRFLEDDPADHRGILSWFAQPQNRTLQEAGTYGYLTAINISSGTLDKAFEEGVLRIRLMVDESLPGGLSIYGEKFGRFPVNPTIVFELSQE